MVLECEISSKSNLDPCDLDGLMFVIWSYSLFIPEAGPVVHIGFWWTRLMLFLVLKLQAEGKMPATCTICQNFLKGKGLDHADLVAAVAAVHDRVAKELEYAMIHGRVSHLRFGMLAFTFEHSIPNHSPNQETELFCL